MLTFGGRFAGKNIEVVCRSDLWHKTLKHLVAVVGGVVHQDLIPDQKQPHPLTSQLTHTQTQLYTVSQKITPPPQVYHFSSQQLTEILT